MPPRYNRLKANKTAASNAIDGVVAVKDTLANAIPAKALLHTVGKLEARPSVNAVASFIVTYPLSTVVPG
jgi:hypothetical protein